ncbi:hypothetical protein LZC95_23635 [Pendulispora brunnea]|uniref:Uncharacterized protein n=1 Tax=Pendulispora brunnea TaxID=2905690 RepID=A0ABZ2KMQ1_9BACT
MTFDTPAGIFSRNPSEFAASLDRPFFVVNEVGNDAWRYAHQWRVMLHNNLTRNLEITNK